MQDTAFSLCFAALQVVQAACAVGCTQNSATALTALAYVTVLQSIGLVVQMACAISWRIVVHARRESVLSSEDMRGSSAVLQVPLVPPNPLGS